MSSPLVSSPLYGLGMQYNSVSPADAYGNYSMPATPPRRPHDGAQGSPSPSGRHGTTSPPTPGRLQIHQPYMNTAAPIPQSQQSPQQQQQQQQQQQFSLRPTHSRSNGPYTSFSSIPPPPQPSFAPAASSPLRPRPENGAHYGSYDSPSSREAGQYEQLGEDDGQLVSGRQSQESGESFSSSALRQSRPSKSSDLLKRLSRPQTTGPRAQSPKLYARLGDDDEDDEEERLNFPAGDPRASASPSGGRFPGPSIGADSQPPFNPDRPLSWDGSDFPTPPTSTPAPPYSNKTSPPGSDESFNTAPQEKQPMQYPENPAQSSPQFRVDQQPQQWQMQQQQKLQQQLQQPPQQQQQQSQQPQYMPRRHSNSQQALFAAETGGMIRLDGNGQYIAGNSPGEAPAATRRPRPTSMLNPGQYPPVPPNPQRNSGHSMLSTHSNTPSSHTHSSGHTQSSGAYVSAGSVVASANSHVNTQPSSNSNNHSYSQAHSASSGPSPQLDFTARNSGAWMPTPSPPPSAEESGSGRGSRHSRRHSDGDAILARQGTLFHPDSNAERSSQELDVMLGKARNRRLSANRLLPAPDSPAKQRKEDKIRLEASKKGRARVELNVVLERECVVEGADLRGRLEVVVRGGKRTAGLRIGSGKIRIVGFEEVHEGSQARHIFYQHQYMLPTFTDGRNGPQSRLFADAPDSEGFCLAREGTHAIPFSVPIPVGGGAKGSYHAPGGKGPSVRYIVIASVKLHIPAKAKRAIAHFYRPVIMLPYINPGVALAPLRNPLAATRESALGWSIGGEKGRVKLHAALGRRIWVAGQRVWCEVSVINESNKKINHCTIAIIQTVQTFGPPKGKKVATGEPISIARRKIAEETLEADFMDVGSGHVTGRGWWTGLEPGEGNRWDLSVPIPTGFLTIRRTYYIDVSYNLRITLNNGTYVDLPIEIINFLSIDPPPMPSDTRRMARNRMPVTGGVMPVEANPPVSVAQLGYTVEQLRGEPSGNLQAARTSSTTLHIDTLVKQGRARAEQQGRQMNGDEVEDLEPRPESPGSRYSTMAGSTVRQRQLARSNSLVTDEQSVDEDERHHYAIEAARAQGRDRSLEVLNSEDRSESYCRVQVSPDADAMAERELDPYRLLSDGGHSDDAEQNNDPTPIGSPLAFQPTVLQHITEEEEEDLEDVFTTVDGGDDYGGGRKFYDEEGDETDATFGAMGMPVPRIGDDSPRRSLEERLAIAVGRTQPSGGGTQPDTPSSATSSAAAAQNAVITAVTGTAQSSSPHLSQTGSGVDYAEPLDVPELDQTLGRTRGNASGFTLPAPFSTRVISWGPQFRSVSGISSHFTADDHDRLPAVEEASSREHSAEPIEAAGAGAKMSNGRELHHDLSKANLSAIGDGQDAALADADEDELVPPGPFAARRMESNHTGQGSSSGQSFVTAADNAEADGADGVPQLAPSTGSASSDDGATATPESPSESVQSSPTPTPRKLTVFSPAAGQSPHLRVPERFRPAPPPPMSDDSHESHYAESMISTAHSSVMLPTVKNRIAQIESRDEALRKFSVAGSAALGLTSPTPSRLELPQTPQTPPAQRRSYTSALSQRSPQTPRFAFDDDPMSPAKTGSSTAGSERSGMTSSTRRVVSPHRRSAPSWDSAMNEPEMSQNASRLLSRALSTVSAKSDSTSATDIEHAISAGSRSPALTPRGPRPKESKAGSAAGSAVGVSGPGEHGSSSATPTQSQPQSQSQSRDITPSSPFAFFRQTSYSPSPAQMGRTVLSPPPIFSSAGSLDHATAFSDASDAVSELGPSRSVSQVGHPGSAPASLDGHAYGEPAFETHTGSAVDLRQLRSSQSEEAGEQIFPQPPKPRASALAVGQGHSLAWEAQRREQVREQHTHTQQQQGQQGQKGVAGQAPYQSTYQSSYNPPYNPYGSNQTSGWNHQGSNQNQASNPNSNSNSNSNQASRQNSYSSQPPTSPSANQSQNSNTYFPIPFQTYPRGMQDTDQAEHLLSPPVPPPSAKFEALSLNEKHTRGPLSPSGTGGPVSILRNPTASAPGQAPGQGQGQAHGSGLRTPTSPGPTPFRSPVKNNLALPTSNSNANGPVNGPTPSSERYAADNRSIASEGSFGSFGSTGYVPVGTSRLPPVNKLVTGRNGRLEEFLGRG